MQVLSNPTTAPLPMRKPVATKSETQEEKSWGDTVSDVVYKSSRTLAGAVGATAGVVVGLPFGSVKGAVSESNQLSPKAVRALRTTGAIVATAAGIVAGLNGFGAALGLSNTQTVVASALVGPLVGSVATNAAVGLGEGLVSGASGAVDGVVSFAKKGAAIGTGAVDWIVKK